MRGTAAAMRTDTGTVTVTQMTASTGAALTVTSLAVPLFLLGQLALTSLRGLNNAYAGGLSSYCLLLLIVSFLQV